MARRAAKKRGNTVTVDFSDADLRNYVNREGEYLFKVTGAEEDDGKIIMDCEVVSKVQNGRTLKVYFNLEPKTLWFLGQFLEAAGLDIPDSEEDLDLDEWVDKEFVGRVEEHEWDDKKYMRIRAFMDADDFEGERGGKKGKKEEEPEEEDSDEEDKPVKRGRGRPRKGEEKSTKKKKKKLTQDEVNDMDEDELGELVEEHELDVDLDDFKTLKKKVVAVIDALQEVDLIEDE